MSFCPLSSGSKGNSVFFGSQKTKILIDAGIGFKELSSRLEQINVRLSEIEAILITHEHFDHIDGLKTIIQKLDIPVFANSETARGIYENLKVLPSFKIFTTGETFEFKDLLIHPFSIQHDTLDPVGFTIKTSGLKVGFCTDLGFATSLVKKNLEGCDFLYLEANHDLNMLYSSRRPEILKKRISGRQGHLSNKEALSLLEAILHPKLKHVFLAHLSQECNSEELVQKLFQEYLISKNIKARVSIAYQDKVSDLISLQAETDK